MNASVSQVFASLALLACLPLLLFGLGSMHLFAVLRRDPENGHEQRPIVCLGGVVMFSLSGLEGLVVLGCGWNIHAKVLSHLWLVWQLLGPLCGSPFCPSSSGRTFCALALEFLAQCRCRCYPLQSSSLQLFGTLLRNRWEVSPQSEFWVGHSEALPATVAKCTDPSAGCSRNRTAVMLTNYQRRK